MKHLISVLFLFHVCDFIHQTKYDYIYERIDELKDINANFNEFQCPPHSLHRCCRDNQIGSATKFAPFKRKLRGIQLH